LAHNLAFLNHQLIGNWHNDVSRFGEGAFGGAAGLFRIKSLKLKNKYNFALATGEEAANRRI
jgi:hypothetical protein